MTLLWYILVILNVVPLPDINLAGASFSPYSILLFVFVITVCISKGLKSGLPVLGVISIFCFCTYGIASSLVSGSMIGTLYLFQFSIFLVLPFVCQSIEPPKVFSKYNFLLLSSIFLIILFQVISEANSPIKEMDTIRYGGEMRNRTALDSFNSNALGVYIVLFIFCSLFAYDKLYNYQKIFIIGASLILIYMLGFTFSRGAFLLLLVLVASISLWLMTNGKARNIIYILLFSCILILLIYQFFYERFSGIFIHVGSTSFSLSNPRLTGWREAYYLMDNLFAGSGVFFSRPVDSTYLGIFYSLGAVGICLYGVYLYFLFQHCLESAYPWFSITLFLMFVMYSGFVDVFAIRVTLVMFSFLFWLFSNKNEQNYA